MVVACVNAITRRLTPPQVFLRHHLTLAPGDVFDPGELATRFADMGYERTALTEIPGSFSLRGSIIDVFPITESRPYRIEFFDDEIETIRFFDPDSQLSSEQVSQITVAPARELPVDDLARSQAALLLEQELEETKQRLHGEDKKRLGDIFNPLLEHLHEAIWDNSMESLMGYFYNDAGSIFDYLVDGVIILSEPQQIKQVSEDLKNERNTRYFDLLESRTLITIVLS